MKFLDDIQIGAKFELGRHTFTAQEIKTFAERFDPQAFHVDEEAAARSHFGGLVASGWHTAAMCMRFIVEQKRKENEAQVARGEPSAKTGVSPGFRELKWIKPVRAGDTITYASEILEARALATRPGWGLLFSRNTGTNQAGEVVFSFIGSVFVQRRPE
jgi:acyl dehydratase